MVMMIIVGSVQYDAVFESLLVNSIISRFASVFIDQ